MRALRVMRFGEPPEALRLEEAPPPRPGPGELLIEVSAAALNFPDVLMCRGEYQEQPEPPFTPGVEVSGRVVAAGDGGSRFTPGQRVAAVAAPPHGGLAEYAVAGAAAAFPLPDTIDDDTAAALTVSYQTAYLGLHRRAGLRSGEVLLVHAGAGAVGSAAIQLGVAAGARVLATAGSPEKVRRCLESGAETAIDYRADDFAAAVQDATNGRGADVILDPVGGEVLDRSRRCVAWEGRILTVGFASGRIPEVRLNQLLYRNYAVTGIYWAGYLRRDPELVQETHATLLDLHAAGRIRPRVSETLPLERVPAALSALARGATWGKLIAHPR